MLDGLFAYAEIGCDECHGDVPPDDEIGIWVGPQAAIDLFDSEIDGYRDPDGNDQFLELAEFIEEFMPSDDMVIVDIDTANALAAFMSDEVGVPWCPGDFWPPI